MAGFKKRFEILEKAMKAIKPGLKFVLNAEKPTKGVFIVRTDKGEVIWSMTGLTRPFQPLKVVMCWLVWWWWWRVKEKVGRQSEVDINDLRSSFGVQFCQT